MKTIIIATLSLTGIVLIISTLIQLIILSEDYLLHVDWAKNSNMQYGYADFKTFKNKFMTSQTKVGLECNSIWNKRYINHTNYCNGQIIKFNDNIMVMKNLLEYYKMQSFVENKREQLEKTKTINWDSEI